MKTIFSDEFNDILYKEQNGVYYHITKESAALMP